VIYLQADIVEQPQAAYSPHWTQVSSPTAAATAESRLYRPGPTEVAGSAQDLSVEELVAGLPWG